MVEYHSWALSASRSCDGSSTVRSATPKSPYFASNLPGFITSTRCRCLLFITPGRYMTTYTRAPNKIQVLDTPLFPCIGPRRWPLVSPPYSVTLLDSRSVMLFWAIGKVPLLLISRRIYVVRHTPQKEKNDTWWQRSTHCTRCVADERMRHTVDICRRKPCRD
jgi:hypothetical protein